MFHKLSDRALLSIGVILCVIAAWCTIGYHHPDEHFQIWEFAHYKLGRIPASELAWEFPAQMRPGLQPFMAYSVIRFFEWMGLPNPFIQVFFMRLVCGLAALWVYWKWTQWLAHDLEDPEALRWMRLGILFFWLMPYLNVRFSSENTSAICFFGGLLVLVKSLDKPRALQLITAGLLLGLSFFFRFQIAFATIGLGAWLIWVKRPGFHTWLWLFLGGLMATGIGLATDVWLYGKWVFAPYNYFFSNIVEGKAATFGVEPFWWYITELPVAFLPPLSIWLLLLAGYGLFHRPVHVFSWCLIPFVLAHSLVAHKEVRFLFPMALVFFFLAAVGWKEISTRRTFSMGWTRFFRFLIFVNMVVLIFRMLTPAKELTVYARYLWNWGKNHPESTVYFVMNEPRKNFPLNMPFYKFPNQQQLTWYTDPLFMNDTLALKSGDLFFFTEVSNPVPQAPPGFQMKRVFHYYPDWIRKFNANDWQSRTRIYEAYEIQPLR